ncbi:MAG: Gldg family protein [Pirellulaceae bacterium]
MNFPLIEFVFMLVIDLAFLVCLLLVMLPLGLYRQAAFAVMKRNFSGYFSNPTGYVFLCLFVLLTSFAAFWPHEFFTTNLANFDQLNKFLPYIMLVFIPAITMSVWADERRQGTDELLLTLPARDFDIVIGKYFAAVLVFTVSLLFSQLSNYGVLLALTGGELDPPLLFSTYLGYWFIGVAMLAIGMVASFLTNNLTVGFMFGAAFNAPLAFFSNSDVILSNSVWIERLFNWSLLQRFEPFGRGLISPSSIFYFVGLIIIGLFLCLILIGRRHWLGGRDGTSMLWHYLARAVFLMVAVIATVLIVQFSPINRARLDVSQAKVSTLSPTTIQILENLEKQTADAEGRPPEPIKIEAYVSAEVPTEYVQTKYDLVNLLREYDVLGGNRVQVNLHQGISLFSADAILAEKRYGIRPVTVQSQSRGTLRPEELILGVAVSSGRSRIVIPFFPYGSSVEYELSRSINSVANPAKLTLGIVDTDAMALGGVVYVRGQDDQVQPMSQPMLQTLSEMQKQYNLERVNAANPIQLFVDEEGAEPRRRYDVLVAVQPSKMSPDEMANLINAIKGGQPTLIFEDTFPQDANFRTVGGTHFERRLPRPTTESGNYKDLFAAIDIDIEEATRMDQATKQPVSIPWLVWQSTINPYPRNPQLNQPEQLIVRQESPSEERFNPDDPATRGINEVLFQFSSYINQKSGSSLEFTPLVTTANAGRILLSDYLSARSPEEMASARQPPSGNYTLAARIQGSLAKEPLSALAKDQAPSKFKVNVIFVADIDVMSNFFIQLRDYPIQNGVRYRFQNTALVQNLIDSMAGVETYLDLRTRQQRHSTLRVVELETEKTRQRVYDTTQEFIKELQTAQEKQRVEALNVTRDLDAEVKGLLAKQQRNEPVDALLLNSKKQNLEQLVREQQQKLESKFEELENGRREKERAIELEAEYEIQQIQRKFKLAAVLIPPIPPLLLGLFVFTRRRLLEREGISKARRLK